MSPVAAPARAPRRAPARPASPREAPRRPDLYVVKPPATTKPAPSRTTRSAPSRSLIGIIAVGLLFLVLFAIAVLQTVLVQGQMHLDDLQQQISDQQAEAQRLRLEAATLSSPDQVVAAAQAMGMTVPMNSLSILKGSSFWWRQLALAAALLRESRCCMPARALSGP